MVCRTAGSALFVRQVPRGFIRYVFGCPDLPMRMRIAGSHYGATVLKDLHVGYVFARTELRFLRYPNVYDSAYRFRFHSGERKVMSWIDFSETSRCAE